VKVRLASASLVNFLKTILPLAALAAGAAAAMPGAASPAASPPPQAMPPGLAARYGTLPIRFEPNVGQADPAVRYLARGGGYAVGLTERGAILGLGPAGGKPGASAETVFLRLDPAGARPHPALHPERLQGSASNYFIGNDRSKWHSNVANYGAVRYQQLYPGVDWVVYGNPEQLEYDLVVAPKADPRRIRFKVEGADSLALDGQGNLLIHAGDRTLRQLKPVLYQLAADGTRHSVEGRYRLEGRSFAFAVGSYDRNRALVIDPSLIYSTFLGGSGEDAGVAIAADSSGSAYVLGQTTSTNFPLVGALQRTKKGCSCHVTTFVAKLNPAGTALLYSTYLGGSTDDEGLGIAVDSAGNAYVTGGTQSTDFPTVNPLQAGNLGGYDGFVAKLNPAGNALLYSTYLGGTGDDTFYGIAVDSQGAAYVTGASTSTDYPLASPFQAAIQGSTAAVVSKLNPAGSALDYSTYFGGSVQDSGLAIAVDSSGEAYVAGVTGSSDLPLSHAFQAVNAGGGDGFVAKFNTAGSRLFFSTYLGGTGADVPNAIALDSARNVYIAGYTGSFDFPTANALQATNNSGLTGFVTRLDAAGSSLGYSTYLGGSVGDLATGIAVNSAGEAYVAGGTVSPDFPALSPIGAPITSSSTDFLAKLSAGGNALEYSVGFGNEPFGAAVAVALDGAGNAYVTGTTGSDFPVQNAVRSTFAGGSSDGFIAKINDGALAPPTGLTAAVSSQQVRLGWSAASGASSYSVYQGSAAGAESSTPVMSGLTGTSYTVTGLSNGTHYYFVVKADYPGGASGPSNEVNAVPTVPAGVPFGLSAVPGTVNGSFTLCWNNPTGNVTNNVYRVPSAIGGGHTLVKGGVAGGCTAVSGLNINTDYYFQLTAVNAAGESRGSAVLTVNLPPVPTTVPPPMTGVSATPSAGLVVVCWLRNTSAYSSRVYGVDGPGGGNPVLLRTVRAGGGCVTINGLTNDTTYYFEVSGVNPIGEGTPSPVVHATPKALTAPSGVSMTPGAADGQGTLCWNKAPDNVRNNVYQAADASGASPVLLAGSIAGGCLQITGLAVNTNYYFEVTGTKLGGESPPSAVLRVNLPPAPTTVPPAITGVSTTPGNGQLRVCWVLNPSASGYRVYGVGGLKGENPMLLTTLNNRASGCATISGLTNGTRYYFEITGFNIIGEGPPSLVVSGVPSGP
jgi:hypothetical protein